MVGIKKNDLSDVSSKHNAGVHTVIVTVIEEKDGHIQNKTTGDVGTGNGCNRATFPSGIPGES